MDLWNKIDGYIEVELVSADIPEMLRNLTEHGITLNQIQYSDPLTTRFILSRRQLQTAQQICKKKGSCLKISHKRGMHWILLSLIHRKFLIASLAILAFASVWLPTRILFIRVSGNQKIPASLVLEQAAQCGITFGANRRKVRSEKIKNELLYLIPDLEWAGVNTQGCTAVISVQERPASQSRPDVPQVSRIAAIRDGVITKCTALQGNMLCRPGQAVQKDEILISGYTDCGLSIKAQRAQGEVYAATERNLTVIMPAERDIRKNMTGHRKQYGIIIGKKRINFNKSSRIPYAECAKIYKEFYLALPGGFKLPVCLFCEEYWGYEFSRLPYDVESGNRLLAETAESYLEKQMIAGNILSHDAQFSEEDTAFLLEGTYYCEEMIGREENEEILTNDGEGN